MQLRLPPRLYYQCGRFFLDHRGAGDLVAGENLRAVINGSVGTTPIIGKYQPPLSLEGIFQPRSALNGRRVGALHPSIKRALDVHQFDRIVAL